MLTTTLSCADLAEYVTSQANALFPDRRVPAGDLRRHVEQALERTDHCFSRISVKRFARDGAAFFDHLNTDQYAMFLYLLSNSVFRGGGDPALAAKVYALNKALHGLDVFYEVALPEVFFFQHPVGTVLGRATYGNYFAVYQRCSVGSNLDGDSPVFDPGVVMFGGSAVIGRCHVGANVWLSFGAQIMDRDVPAGSVAFGQSPHDVFKPTARRVTARFFGDA